MHNSPRLVNSSQKEHKYLKRRLKGPNTLLRILGYELPESKKLARATPGDVSPGALAHQSDVALVRLVRGSSYLLPQRRADGEP